MNNTLNPMMVLEKSAQAFLLGLKSIFKNKRKLLLIAILAIIWITLIILPYVGFNPLPVKIASFLTFAQGGASLNVARVIGGVIGKGIYAVFFVSLFDGGFKSIKSGFKPLWGHIKSINKYNLAYLFLGIGIAAILYNFLVGYAALIKGMVGIAAIALVLSAIGLKQGFIYSLILAASAKRYKSGPKPNQMGCDLLLTGLSLGFFLSIFLSIIPIGFAPYLFGLFCLILGIVFIFVFKNKEAKS
ncbi:MAG: hypothetical protein PHW37_03295 [Acholeplasmataceae bacterium]|nr:hypothetical protein [Acholeplasmataceae bacterium]